MVVVITFNQGFFVGLLTHHPFDLLVLALNPVIPLSYGLQKVLGLFL